MFRSDIEGKRPGGKDSFIYHCISFGFGRKRNWYHSLHNSWSGGNVLSLRTTGFSFTKENYRTI